MNKLKEANENSFPAQRWLFEVYETPYKEMSYGVKTIAGVIALCAWGKKDTSFPSYKSIRVALGGASEETIANAVEKLTEMGFLSVSKVKTKAGLRNDYRLVFPNTLDTEVINTSDTEVITNTSVAGAITSDTRVNHFGYEDQSLHTGEVEALIEPLTQATIEAREEKKEDAFSVILDLLQDSPSSLDAERSSASVPDEASISNDELSYAVLGDPNWVSQETQQRRARMGAKREAWGME